MKWYQCARCDAGYPDQGCTCAPRFEPGPPMSEHEKQRIADALKMSGLNSVVAGSKPTAPDRPSNVSAIAPDPVNNPPHYNQGAVECIDAIESALGAEGFRAYCKGNALKYIWREEHKGGTESIEKAIWYLDRLVSGR